MSVSLSVRDLAGKNVLVTGVTGFLGKVFVAFVLEHDLLRGGRLTLLSRGKRGKDGRARIAELFARSPAFRRLRQRHGAGLSAWLNERIDVVEGDARDAGLGIAPAQRATLAARLDAVVHVAGLTDFSPDPNDGLAVNVHGALAAADLAAGCRGKRLLHVSTCFVAGGIDGEAPEVVPLSQGMARSPNGTVFDPEAELLAMESLCRGASTKNRDEHEARKARIEAGTLRARSLGWPNLYTYTKALAELLITKRHQGPRAPRITIVRPAIVECARTFPLPGWNEGVNTAAPLVWLTGTMHRRMPFTSEHVFDVIPVDEVVKGTTLALAALLRPDAPALDVVQLATGDHNPFTFGRVLDLTALARRRQYARSSDPLERAVLQHLDSVIHDVAPEKDPILPALRTGTRAVRDLLVGFDPDIHLPKALRGGWGDKLASLASKAGKELGQASRTLGQVDEMLKAYQPFVFDHDPRFVTARARDLTGALPADEREGFGVDTASIDWRDYWMNVEIPGLDKWSLPMLRGERPPEDEPVPLSAPLMLVEASEAPITDDVDYAGDAE